MEQSLSIMRQNLVNNMYSLVSNPSFLLWSMFSLTHNQQLDLLDEKSSKVDCSAHEPDGNAAFS